MADIDADVELPEEEDDAEGGEAEKPPKKVAPKEEEESEEEGDESDADEDDPSKLQVPVRSSAVASHIIARQKKKIENLRKGKDSTGDEEEEADGDESDEEADPELSQSAQRALDARIQKAVRPLAEKLASDSDEKELGALLSSVPEAKKYEKRIRAFMAHPGYRQVPPEFIFQSLAFKDAQKIGATKKANADREAGHSRSGGHPPRKKHTTDSLTADGIKEMDDKEFSALQAKVLTGH